jgi:hypothetical protein
MLPIILLFLMTAVSMFTAEDDPYSFHQNYQYSRELRTSPHDVPYYVQPKQYERRYNTARKKQSLNDQVESDVF